MIGYHSTTFYCIVTLYILCQFILTNGHAATTKVPRTKNGTRSAGRYPSRTKGTVIILKSGPDGTPQEQCECRPWHLCGAENKVDTSVSGLDCNDDKVCCKINSAIFVDDEIPGSLGPRSSYCGMRNNNQQILNRVASPVASSDHSKSTSFGEFPWMALLLVAEIDQLTQERLDNIFVCGASLVSSKIALTAGHCVHNVADVSLLKIRVGEYDTHNVSDKEWKPHQDRQVSKITLAPDFHSDTLYNDLALIEVVEPFKFDYHVHPICIPLISNVLYDYDPNDCVATGWGKDAFGPDGQYARKLQKVNLKILPNVRCQEELRKTRLGEYFTLNPSFICAKNENGLDTCEGDGGGPLVCSLRNDPNRYVQVGVVSWGIGCANDLPAAYASLERNAVWLNNELHSAMILKKKSSQF